MLSHRLLQAITKEPQKICVEAAGASFSYADLNERAAALAACWNRLDPDFHPVAILADHSFTGYAAVVAAIVTGRTYVPLKPGLPPERVRRILAAAGCRLIAGDERQLAPLRAALAETGAAIVPEEGDAGAPPLAPSDEEDPVAYIIFTSGSTGAPKGVVVRAHAVASYGEAVAALFPVCADDRCTQLFDLSFDLSVHDILVTFLAGACLVTDAERQRVDPVGFAAAAGISVWFSVPSVVSVAKRFRRLVPAVLPGLRLALFCGEALPTALAMDWVKAAPNARHYNIYGPSEATIAITWHRFDGATLAGLREASVPIGLPYPRAETVVVAEGKRAAPGAIGELWLGGPQLADGYLGDPEQTKDRFVHATFPGLHGTRWYRTGDLAAESAAAGLLFKGRVDHQVKIRGYRIELDEIEGTIRKSGLVGEVAAFPYDSKSGVAALACAVTGDGIDPQQLLHYCRRWLPDYSMPDRIFVLEQLPLNQNDKVDRKALRAMAEAPRRPG